MSVCDNDFYYRLWKLVAGLLALIVVCITIWNGMHSLATATSERPLEYACASSSVERTHPSCMVLQARGSK